jgi:hypothetical protein
MRIEGREDAEIIRLLAAFPGRLLYFKQVAGIRCSEQWKQWWSMMQSG